MERYILVSGKKMLESEFQKAVAMYGMKQFAYDSQLSLFPIPEVEQARKDLRAKFDKGEKPEIKIIVTA